MGLHRWLMCFGQRLRGSRPRRKIGADTLKPRRALGKTWEQAPTAFEAAQLIKPPALRGVSDCRYNPSENMGYKKEGRDCPRPSLMWLRVRVLETSRQHKIPATVRHVDAGDGAHRIDAGRQLIPVGVVHA